MFLYPIMSLFDGSASFINVDENVDENVGHS